MPDTVFPFDPYVGLTDQQAAYWNGVYKHAAEVEVKLAALSEEKARLEESFRADFDRMAEEIRQLTVAGVAARNKLLFLGQHLPEFVGDFLATYEPFTDAALTPEMVKRRTVAREIMRELEPFGQ